MMMRSLLWGVGASNEIYLTDIKRIKNTLGQILSYSLLFFFVAALMVKVK